LSGYECAPYCPDQACDNSYNPGSTLHYANNGAHGLIAPVQGLAATDTDLSPLRAGCAGGKGSGVDAHWYGGAGGGAVQIVAAGKITVGPTGIISAGGGGGRNISSIEGGSGGGSGGSILLEAPDLVIHLSAALRAHGGSGGGRNCGTQLLAEDGHVTDNNSASAPFCFGAGRGGLAYWDANRPGCDGSAPDAAACVLPALNWPLSGTAYPWAGGVTDDSGGGGGGGAAGLIVVRKLAALPETECTE
jgi:hypothetical protein